MITHALTTKFFGSGHTTKLRACQDEGPLSITQISDDGDGGVIEDRVLFDLNDEARECLTEALRLLDSLQVKDDAA